MLPFKLSKEYLYPSLFAIVLHAVILLWLALDFSGSEKKNLLAPKSIKASLVQLEQKKPKKTTKKTVIKKPIKKPVKKPIKKAKPPTKKTPKPSPKKAVEKPKVDKNLEKKKEEARKRAEELAKQQAREQAEQEAFANDLESELADINEQLANEQASADEQAAMSYMGYIQQAVAANWSRPPMARNGMQVSLQIELIPDGTVVSVNTIKSSGFEAFDRSAITAVKKAERFPELKELESRVFERFYRKFTLIFNPEDLRL